jgi:hypothetical protein
MVGSRPDSASSWGDAAGLRTLMYRPRRDDLLLGEETLGSPWAAHDSGGTSLP